MTLFEMEVRLSIKMQFTPDKKQCDVLQVKKDEIKLLAFDVLALDRYVIHQVVSHVTQ